MDRDDRAFLEHEEERIPEEGDLRDVFGEDPLMEGNLPEEEWAEESDVPETEAESPEPENHDHFFEELRKARAKAGEAAEEEDYFFDPKRAAREAEAARAAEEAALSEEYEDDEAEEAEEYEYEDDYGEEWRERPLQEQAPDEELALKIRRRRSRRSRRRFFRRTALIIVVLVVALLGGLLFVDKQGLADIDTITVSGNAHYTDEEIITASGIHLKTGLISLRTGKAVHRLEELPYVKSAKVTRKPLHTVKVTVAERTPVYAVQAGGFFLIVDDENRILEKANDPGEVMIVEGYIPTSTEEGDEFVPEKATGLKSLLALAEEIEDIGMPVYKVSYLNAVTRVYLTRNIVCEGRFENIQAHVPELGEIMSSLHQQEIERATIYIGDNGYISFSPKI